MPEADIEALLVDRAERGETVVRLKPHASDGHSCSRRP